MFPNACAGERARASVPAMVFVIKCVENIADLKKKTPLLVKNIADFSFFIFVRTLYSVGQILGTR